MKITSDSLVVRASFLSVKYAVIIGVTVVCFMTYYKNFRIDPNSYLRVTSSPTQFGGIDFPALTVCPERSQRPVKALQKILKSYDHEDLKAQFPAAMATIAKYMRVDPTDLSSSVFEERMKRLEGNLMRSGLDFTFKDKLDKWISMIDVHYKDDCEAEGEYCDFHNLVMQMIATLRCSKEGKANNYAEYDFVPDVFLILTKEFFRKTSFYEENRSANIQDYVDALWNLDYGVYPCQVTAVTKATVPPTTSEQSISTTSSTQTTSTASPIETKTAKTTKIITAATTPNEVNVTQPYRGPMTVVVETTKSQNLSECITESGFTCKTYFYYLARRYDECISKRSSRSWCYVEGSTGIIFEHGLLLKKWDYCTEGCPGYEAKRRKKRNAKTSTVTEEYEVGVYKRMRQDALEFLDVAEQILTQQSQSPVGQMTMFAALPSEENEVCAHVERFMNVMYSTNHTIGAPLALKEWIKQLQPSLEYLSTYFENSVNCQLLRYIGAASLQANLQTLKKIINYADHDDKIDEPSSFMMDANFLKICRDDLSISVAGVQCGCRCEKILKLVIYNVYQSFLHISDDSAAIPDSDNLRLAYLLRFIDGLGDATMERSEPNWGQIRSEVHKFLNMPLRSMNTSYSRTMKLQDLLFQLDRKNIGLDVHDERTIELLSSFLTNVQHIEYGHLFREICGPEGYYHPFCKSNIMKEKDLETLINIVLDNSIQNVPLSAYIGKRYMKNDASLWQHLPTQVSSDCSTFSADNITMFMRYFPKIFESDMPVDTALQNKYYSHDRLEIILEGLQTNYDNEGNSFWLNAHKPNELPLLKDDSRSNWISIDFQDCNGCVMVVDLELVGQVNHYKSTEASLNSKEGNVLCKRRNDPQRLKLFQYYARTNCLTECHWDLAEKACGCRPWDVPSTETDAVCSFFGTVCYQVILSALAGNRTIERDCDCPHDCEDHYYHLKWEASKSYGLDEIFEENTPERKEIADALRQLKTHLSKTDDVLYINESISWDPLDTKNGSKLHNLRNVGLVRVKISAKSSLTNHTLEYDYSWEDFLAWVGGHLGFICGFCLMTFLELPYAIFNFVSGIRKKSLKRCSVSASYEDYKNLAAALDRELVTFKNILKRKIDQTEMEVNALKRKKHKERKMMRKRISSLSQ